MRPRREREREREKKCMMLMMMGELYYIFHHLRCCHGSKVWYTLFFFSQSRSCECSQRLRVVQACYSTVFAVMDRDSGLTPTKPRTPITHTKAPSFFQRWGGEQSTCGGVVMSMSPSAYFRNPHLSMQRRREGGGHISGVSHIPVVMVLLLLYLLVSWLGRASVR